MKLQAKAVQPLPVDTALPSLPDVLEPDSVVASIEQSIGVACDAAAARWLRWRPGRRAVVLYEVTLAGRQTWAVVTIEAGTDAAALAASPEARRLSAATRGRCASPQPIHALQDLGALVEWYPAAICLPGLASLPMRMHDLGDAWDGAEPVVYRPAQRAVLRSGGLYWKAYASPARFGRAVDALTQAATIEGLRTPTLVASFSGDRLTAQRALDGVPLPDSPTTRSALGQALRRLHASGVRTPRTVTASDHLKAGRKAAAIAAAAAPWLAPRVGSLVNRLAAAQPARSEPVPSHGDFHDRQALSVDGNVALLDFDSMMLADPAFDFARFGAHQGEGPAGAKRALDRMDDLAEGYGGRPASLEWYFVVALLRRLAHPLRRLDQDWPEQMRWLLDAAEEGAAR